MQDRVPARNAMRFFTLKSKHYWGACCSALLFLAGCSQQPLPDASIGSNVGQVIDSVQPLADPAESSSTTLFEKLPAAEIGVDFVHRWAPRNDHERMLLKTAFTGGGVCLGDFDNDGWCDLLLTSPHGGGHLYRNLGDFQFENATQKAKLDFGDAWLTGATFVDVNNDGWNDLFVCTYGGSNFLYLNCGDGTFQNQTDATGLDFVGANVKMTFADYDLDGDLDAFLVTNRREPTKPVKIRYEGSQGNYTVAPEHQELALVINLPNGEQKFTKAGQRDHLFQNQFVETGQLTFRDVSERAGLSGNFHGLDATWWDHNGDGFPDLYIANDFTDPDQFWQNNGDGTFSDILETAVPNTPWFCMAATPGDLNNDGRLDLFTTDMAGTTHYRQKKAMGSMDAVAWFLDTAEPRQFMRNALFVNTGTERFMEVAQMAGIASSDWSWSVQIADFDNDGYEDIFVTNGFPRDYMDSDFNIQLARKGLQGNPFAWHQAPELKEENVAFRNLGNLEFEKVSKEWGLGEVGVSFGAAVGDLDNDGDLDLVINNYEGAPSIFRNTSTANRMRIAFDHDSKNVQGLGARVQLTTAMGTQTRYIANGSGFMSANQTGAFFGLADQTKATELRVTWPDGSVTTHTDLAAGHRYPIAKEVSSTKPASGDSIPARRPWYRQWDLIPDWQHRETPFDDFAQQPLLPNKLSQLGPSMTWADINGDGRDDLYIGGAAGQAGTIHLRLEDGGFRSMPSPAFHADAKCEDMGCLFLDVDADGDQDLYVVSGGVEAEVNSQRYRDRLYVNQGVGNDGRVSFVRSIDAVPDLRDSGGPVVASDFDHDGDLDLFVGGRVVPGEYPTAPKSRLLINEQGRFQEHAEALTVSLKTVGMVTGAIWSDINADGWSDLLVTTEYGPVNVFTNRQGELYDATKRAGTAHLLGWWNGIAGADVDEDGDKDFVVTNFGWNTKYHPTVEKPQQIYFGDFDNSGTRRIVEAKKGTSGFGTSTDNPGLLPVRGLSCSSNAMPFVREKFPTFHSFAVASLADIYGDGLQDAYRVEVNTVSSGVLLNDGTGKFEFLELPRLAQVAPGFGAAFLHANNDNILDLFVAQNFYSPQRETGRMAGGMGQLMIGVGNGTFATIGPVESGIVMPGDARAVKVVDLNSDGKQDLVVTQNNGKVVAFVRNE